MGNSISIGTLSLGDYYPRLKRDSPAHEKETAPPPGIQLVFQEVSWLLEYENNNSNNNDNNNNNNNNSFPMAWKYRVGIRRGIAMSHGQVKHSSTLVGNHLEMVSQQKYCW